MFGINVIFIQGSVETVAVSARKPRGDTQNGGRTRGTTATANR